MRLLQLFRTPILLVFILVIAFLFVQPRIRHMLFPQTRQAALNEFIQNIKQNHDVDLAAYWQFRDFYSPGSLQFDKKGLTADTNTLIPIIKDMHVTPQLLFVSSKIISAAGRTNDQSIPVTLSKKHILFASKSVVLTGDINEYTLIFLKPISEIQKVNGFLEHDTSSDDKNGTMWLEVTRIKKE